MPNYPIHTIASAPEKSKPALEQLQKAFGVLPNLPAVIANSPKLINSLVGLIWSDPVNPAESMGLFLSLSLFFLFPEDRASSSLGRFERRLISLIFAGRNRIIMIRRELPLTVIASPVEPVA